jgi:hypothetical protein
VAGTKEARECSGRGLCDTETGRCACFGGFGSSDGFGNAGERGDCGQVLRHAGQEQVDLMMSVNLE